MNKTRRARLETQGWQVGNAAELLELTPVEAAYVGLKLSLTEALRGRRTAKHLTQTDLARRLGSSQSRVAKMEAGDASATFPPSGVTIWQ